MAGFLIKFYNLFVNITLKKETNQCCNKYSKNQSKNVTDQQLKVLSNKAKTTEVTKTTSTKAKT